MGRHEENARAPNIAEGSSNNLKLIEMENSTFSSGLQAFLLCELLPAEVHGQAQDQTRLKGFPTAGEIADHGPYKAIYQ